jgi:hypothetical protein
MSAQGLEVDNKIMRKTSGLGWTREHESYTSAPHGDTRLEHVLHTKSTQVYNRRG